MIEIHDRYTKASSTVKRSSIVCYLREERSYLWDINLSNVSFINADLTGIRFTDKTRWGREKAKEDRFKIVDERLLEDKIEEKDGHTTKDFNLGSIKAVYRSLRENYECRMRYDEAGQFFIREIELKRKYREVVSPQKMIVLRLKLNKIIGLEETYSL